MNENEANAILAKGAIWAIVTPLVPALLALMVVWEGYVFTFLWNWFVVRQFGMALVTTPMSIGLLLVTKYVRQTRPFIKGEELDTTKNFAQSFVGPALLLLVGYLAHRCMP